MNNVPGSADHEGSATIERRLTVVLVAEWRLSKAGRRGARRDGVDTSRIPSDARPRAPLRRCRVVDPFPGEADHVLRRTVEQCRSLSDVVQPLWADLKLPDRVFHETGRGG